MSRVKRSSTNIWRALRRSMDNLPHNTRSESGAKRRSTRIRPWMVVTILCLIYLVAILLIYKNVLEFVRPGARFAGTWSSYIRNQNDDGYDGQFDYYIALDPANAPLHLDVPAYRYQRVLYPMLARVVVLGQASLIPYALV